jgi:hypothetical protein
MLQAWRNNLAMSMRVGSHPFLKVMVYSAVASKKKFVRGCGAEKVAVGNPAMSGPEQV